MAHWGCSFIPAPLPQGHPSSGPLPAAVRASVLLPVITCLRDSGRGCSNEKETLSEWLTLSTGGAVSIFLLLSRICCNLTPPQHTLIFVLFSEHLAGSSHHSVFACLLVLSDREPFKGRHHSLCGFVFLEPNRITGPQ